VSVWGGSPTEDALIRSLVHLLLGRTNDAWTVGEQATVGLVLIGNAAEASLPVPTGPRVSAEILKSNESASVGVTLTITRPIRVLPLIDLLNEAGNRLRAESAHHFQQALVMPQIMVTPTPAVQFSSAISAAQTLQNLRQQAGMVESTALLTATGAVIAVIHVGPGVVFSTLPLNELVTALEQQFQDSKPLSSLGVDVSGLIELPPQSLDALCWKIGASLVNSVGLAPWLHITATYRMLGWPDFGAIGVDRHGLKLSAAMLAKPISPELLHEKTQLSLTDVFSFFNSASVSGLIAAAIDATAKPVSAPPPTVAVVAPRRSMIALLRSKLGLS
jgi:hypothetical protein